ncbi:MAG TPA: carboxypeptidase-like regulatory domain-containing protein, partial [Pyrinomonadaceae bacterium]|nr:carboxypeptidase-like regulatory domain-containing protein [Pyrinomonadaceae bacterium]
MRFKFIEKFFIAVFVVLFSQTAFAQATGSLSGTVKDPNGSVVQGTTITVKNTATNLSRTYITNDEGIWTATLLPVGIYSVTFEKEGFKKAISENI